MTIPARISQGDIDRAVKAAAKAECARVILRLASGEIEIIIGGSEPVTTERLWSDDDY